MQLPAYIPPYLPMLLIMFAMMAIVVHHRRREQRLIINHCKIRLGMTKKEVISLLGRQYRKKKGDDGSVQYRWHYSSIGFYVKFAGQTVYRAPRYERIVYVTFVNDHVIRVDADNMNV